MRWPASVRSISRPAIDRCWALVGGQYVVYLRVRSIVAVSAESYSAESYRCGPGWEARLLQLTASTPVVPYRLPEVGVRVPTVPVIGEESRSAASLTCRHCAEIGLHVQKV